MIHEDGGKSSEKVHLFLQMQPEKLSQQYLHNEVFNLSSEEPAFKKGDIKIQLEHLLLG